MHQVACEDSKEGNYMPLFSGMVSMAVIVVICHTGALIFRGVVPVIFFRDAMKALLGH